MKAVERATRKSLKVLREDGRLSDETEGLAATAIVLARELDNGGGDAGVARELRLILDTIRKGDKANDDDYDAWVAGLSAPVGDTQDS